MDKITFILYNINTVVKYELSSQKWLWYVGDQLLFKDIKFKPSLEICFSIIFS